MSNFKQDIINAVVDVKDIEAVLILSPLDIIYNFETHTSSPDPRDKNVIIGVPLTWEQAAPMLDYEYSAGYGSMDCHNIEIFTKDLVYYINEYDGSTSIYYVNRHPVDLGASK